MERFDGALRAVLDSREDEVVAVVTHGTVISLFIARYNDVEAYALWRKLGLPSFSILSVPDFELQGVTYNLSRRR